MFYLEMKFSGGKSFANYAAARNWVELETKHLMVESITQLFSNVFYFFVAVKW